VKILNKDIGKEGIKYAVVGLGGYVLDVGLFNFLSIVNSQQNLGVDQILIKASTTVLAISFTYIGNSRWTFSKRDPRPHTTLRLNKYFVVNFVGLLLTLLPMYISRNVLGFESLLADNISANIIGVGLAAIFRFIASRFWVFTPRSPILDDPIKKI
jgi:putative flippase GtrA